MKEIIIEIKGVQFVNKGAELMLRSAYAALMKMDIGPFRIALSPRNSPFDKRSEFFAYQKLGNLRYRIDTSRLLPSVPGGFTRSYGFVSHDNVDVVLDASGFAYGDQWTTSLLRHSVRQAERMRARGRPYLLLPQAFGPFSSAEARRQIGRLCAAAAVTFARDATSLGYLKQFCPQSTVELSPDFTNLLEVEPDPGSYGRVVIIPNVKMLTHTKFDASSYLERLTTYANAFRQKGLKVTVMNHEGPSDAQIVRDISARLSPDVETYYPVDALEAKRYIGGASAVVSSRFHGCVSSLSQAIPTIATSWSHKYEELMASYGSLGLLDKMEGGVEDRVEEVAHNGIALREQLANHATVEKEKAREMWRYVETVIKSFRSRSQG